MPNSRLITPSTEITLYFMWLTDNFQGSSTYLIMFSQLINKWISKRFQVSTGLFQVGNNLLKTRVSFWATARRASSKCLQMKQTTKFRTHFFATYKQLLDLLLTKQDTLVNTVLITFTVQQT